MPVAIPATLMRGGTSRGLYFRTEDLPDDTPRRDRVLLAAMGSYSANQVDGVGGMLSTTNKVAMVSRSTAEGVDVDYFFAQVEPARDTVDYGPTCGNLLTGIAPFAIDEGIVPGADGETRVRIRLVNTGALVEAVVQTPGGKVTYEGEARIDGIPGTAAPVLLNFLECVGSKTGALFPTGEPSEEIDGVRVSLVDATMPMMLVGAEALGKTAYETPEELDADRDFFTRFEALRRVAGERMGLGDVSERVIPKVAIVAPPREGGTICSRYFVPHQTHRAYAVTGSITLAAAACIPGTVAAEVAVGEATEDRTVRVEHPSGGSDVVVSLVLDERNPGLRSAGVIRTARPIFSGSVLVPDAAAA